MSEFLQSLQAELNRQHQMATLQDVGLLLAAGLVFAFFSSRLARARGHHPAVWFFAELTSGPLKRSARAFRIGGLSGTIVVGGLVAGLLLPMAISL